MAKFLIFGLHYPPEQTANAPYTAAYAEALVGAGHIVTVVAGYPHYPEWTTEHRRWRWTTEQQNGVRLIRVPHAIPHSPSALGRLRLEASYGLAAVLPMIRSVDFDVAIGVIPLLSGGVAARLASAVRRRPVGLLVQDLVSAAAAQGGVPGAGRRVTRAVAATERAVIRGASVASVARGFEEQLARLGAASINYMPNFIALPSSRGESRQRVRARLAIPQDAFVVGYSGNLGFKQDFETVVRAAEKLAGDASIYFVIVGDGSQRQLIDKAISAGRIRGARLPLQPSEDVLDVLRAFDLLLAPQRATEVDMSIPSKLTAYFAAGRPVLAAASSHSETAAQVVASGAGMVVEPGSVTSLAAAIIALRAEPSRLEALGQAGYEYAKKAFDRDAALARFCAWTEGLASRRSRTMNDA